MKDWILDHSWVAWVPAMIPCAIGAAWFAWWALELGDLMVWLQSAGYVSGLLAWLAAGLHARSVDRRVELWRETAERWERLAARLELRCRGQNEVIEALIEGGAERSVVPPTIIRPN